MAVALAAVMTAIFLDLEPPEKRNTGHRVGAVDQWTVKSMSGGGYWKGKGACSAVGCGRIDQADILEGGLDKIRFGKVFAESPLIQTFKEAGQLPSNPSGIHSTQQHSIDDDSGAPKPCALGFEGTCKIFCLFLFALFFLLSFTSC